MQNKKIAVISISCILLVLFCVMGIPYFVKMTETSYGTPSGTWYEALEWLRDNTPSESHILAWWDYGYWIKYIADREPVVNPGQHSIKVENVAKYFLSYDDPPVPEEAEYIMIDRMTAYNFLKPMSIWAGYEKGYEEDKTLARRLFLDDVNDGEYTLVFNNGIRIYRHTGAAS